MQLIIDLNSVTHPQAAILNIDLQHNTVDFRWIGGPYDGDCKTEVTVSSLANAQAEIVAALEAIIPVNAPG